MAVRSLSFRLLALGDRHGVLETGPASVGCLKRGVRLPLDRALGNSMIGYKALFW